MCNRAPCGLRFAQPAAVLIRISRTVRVALSGEELQTLNSGEFYEVMPAVGLVLVADGWAVEAVTERHEPPAVVTADDDPGKPDSGS
jgi:hypothetical protein